MRYDLSVRPCCAAGRGWYNRNRHHPPPGDSSMRRFLPLLAIGLLAPPLIAETPKKAETYEVPYRLTIPKHILVRAKINNKGPFNFILDTGAPALFLSEEAAKKAGVKPDNKGWGTFDRFEIEGGVVLPKAKGRIETIFQ